MKNKNKIIPPRHLLSHPSFILPTSSTRKHKSYQRPNTNFPLATFSTRFLPVPIASQWPGWRRANRIPSGAERTNQFRPPQLAANQFRMQSERRHCVRGSPGSQSTCHPLGTYTCASVYCMRVWLVMAVYAVNSAGGRSEHVYHDRYRRYRATSHIDEHASRAR